MEELKPEQFFSYCHKELNTPDGPLACLERPCTAWDPDDKVCLALARAPRRLQKSTPEDLFREYSEKMMAIYQDSVNGPSLYHPSGLRAVPPLTLVDPKDQIFTDRPGTAAPPAEDPIV